MAVLDTGYDATHPDLLGKVTDAADFSGSQAGVKDEHGHGTHVAGTIVGSSHERYRGTAPDAKLLVGKVCDGEDCADSAIIAGMQWAADKGAQVVNVSLGTRDPSDGTDPVSLALNNLTAGTGTLFVVAAGNLPQIIGSPGAADAALTVGSVDSADGHSWFSGAGPRRGDKAVKPDISAPGEGIAAARAAGTSMGRPVDDLYTRADGTSMATPHVAGAAAILVQQHAGWRAGELKSALTSSALPVNGEYIFKQGSGRLDIARAIAQPVRVTPSNVTFGELRWPYADQAPKSRTLTYHNDSESPITLTPAISGVSVNALTLSRTQVTVPAHGTEDLTITLHPKEIVKEPAGIFSMRITARTADGSAVVQTPVGVVTEPESYDLTITLVGRDGKPASDGLPQFVSLVGLDNQETPNVSPEGGVAKVRLPKGAYAVTTDIFTARGEPDPATAAVTVATKPRLVVDRDTAVTFDARQGKRVTAKIDVPDPLRFAETVDLQFVVNSPDGRYPHLRQSTTGSTNELYAVPVRAPADEFTFGYNAILTSRASTHYIAIPSPGRIPDDPSFRVRDSELERVVTRYRAQGVDKALGSRAELAYYLPGQWFSSGVFSTVALPSDRVEYFSAGDVRWHGILQQRAADQAQQPFFQGSVQSTETRYTAGATRRQDWNQAVFGADPSEHSWGGGIVRSGDTISVNVGSFAPTEARHFGNAVFDFVSGITGRTTLSIEDGSGSATSPHAGLGGFSVPAEAGRYVLDIEANRPASAWSALSTKVSTTWRFQSAHRDGYGYEPLPVVRVAGHLDDRNRAPESAWFPLDITVSTQAGAPVADVTSVSLEISDDDGHTWRRAWIRGNDGNTWHAVVFNPSRAATSGFISVRAKASDAAGNSVQSTVIRAYGLTT